MKNFCFSELLTVGCHVHPSLLLCYLECSASAFMIGAPLVTTITYSKLEGGQACRWKYVLIVLNIQLPRKDWKLATGACVATHIFVSNLLSHNNV